MCLAAQVCTPPAGVSQADAILDHLAASGVTVTVSAGDQGSMGPGPLTPCADEMPLFGLPGYASVNWPASSPSVTGVGGTLWLGASRETGEQVWNEPAGGPFNWGCGSAAGGGGTSSMYLRPAWQTPATQAIAGTKRLVPDVSMLAGAPSYVGVDDGQMTMFEGTSAAAPLLASGVLRLNAELMAAGGSALGALNPTLYGTLAAAPGAITDLQIGNNDLFGVDCCTAGVGFDMASGLGSPNLGVWRSVLS
jgi:subtilase family serine protease